MLRVYNTLSGKKEEFKPENPPDPDYARASSGMVKMYVCGITPYDECHIGHARCYVVFDVIRRYLEYRGLKVQYVQNFTDIDDKIINRAKEQMLDARCQMSVKDKTKEIAEKYITDYFMRMDALNVKKADEYPKVTEHIEDIVKVVKGLAEKGYAYVTEEGVYFEVAKFKDYGKLSHRSAEEMMPGARVEVDKKKKSPLDFALWKSAKEDEPSWDSPWGKGRPGWHIECSAMSTKYLGETFDIHGGGQDLIFPHHENEIAQAEAYTGKPFAKYWIHNAFVTVNKEKMSKSLGNFFTIREVLEKYNPMVVRLFLLSAHYRQPINFSDKELDASKESFQRLKTFAEKVSFISEKIKAAAIPEIKNQKFLSLREKFRQAMDDDFNTQKALGYVYELVLDANVIMNKILHGKSHDGETISNLKEAEMLFRDFAEVLGLKIETKILPEEFDSLLAQREVARKNKDWDLADKIRKELDAKGFTIEDTVLGPMLGKDRTA